MRPRSGGRLLLWHGEPGSGKTSALRALLRACDPWCAGQLVADPERLFAEPGYISEIVTRSAAARFSPTLSRAGQSEALWRLLIAEDSDEFLRASARQDAGASLGRLLNLADGVLGQGFNTLILLTTNEDLRRLHPAVVRPGRCLSRVEFTRFPVPEARRWLDGNGAIVPGPCTLAELFELRGDLSGLGGRPEAGAPETGLYL